MNKDLEMKWINSKLQALITLLNNNGSVKSEHINYLILGVADFVNNILAINFNICFRYSKELSHWNSSLEYPQHMFLLRYKKINV